MDKLAIGIGMGILIVAGLLAFPVRRWVLAKWGPTAKSMSRAIRAASSRLSRAPSPASCCRPWRWRRCWIVFVVTLTQRSSIPPFRRSCWQAVCNLVLFFAVSGLSVACLSPELPAWRIVPVPAKAAAKLGHRIVTGAGLLLMVAIVGHAVSERAALQPSASFASILTLVASSHRRRRVPAVPASEILGQRHAFQVAAVLDCSLAGCAWSFVAALVAAVHGLFLTRRATC